MEKLTGYMETAIVYFQNNHIKQPLPDILRYLVNNFMNILLEHKGSGRSNPENSFYWAGFLTYLESNTPDLWLHNFNKAMGLSLSRIPAKVWHEMLKEQFDVPSTSFSDMDDGQQFTTYFGLCKKFVAENVLHCGIHELDMAINNEYDCRRK